MAGPSCELPKRDQVLERLGSYRCCRRAGGGAVWLELKDLEGPNSIRERAAWRSVMALTRLGPAGQSQVSIPGGFAEPAPSRDAPSVRVPGVESPEPLPSCGRAPHRASPAPPKACSAMQATCKTSNCWGSVVAQTETAGRLLRRRGARPRGTEDTGRAGLLRRARKALVSAAVQYEKTWPCRVALSSL